MKKSVLFLPASLRSHIIPAIYLAGLLQNEYEIYFAVADESTEMLVAGQGFHVFRTGSLQVAVGMEEQYVFEKYKKNSRWQTLKAVDNDELYHLRQRELFELMEEIKPAAIFIDIFRSTDILVLYPRYQHIRQIILNPMLSTYRVNGFPALHEGEWIHAHLRQPPATRGVPIKNFLTNPLDAFIARSMEKQFERLTVAGGFASKHPLAPDRTSTLMFEGIPEVIMAPLELEVSPGVRKPNQHYLGLCVDESQHEPDPGEDFDGRFSFILQQKKAGSKLVYCSICACNQGCENGLPEFIETLLSVIQSLRGVTIVFELCEAVVNTLRMLRNIPDTVHLFTRVPQRRVLRHADLFITQGTLDAVRESIYYGVPMLVYPVDLRYDQNGNGLKVEYFGLGLRGVFRSERPLDMKSKIAELLGNEKYLRALTLFRKRVLERYRKDTVLETLHNLLDS